MDHGTLLYPMIQSQVGVGGPLLGHESLVFGPFRPPRLLKPAPLAGL